jgi:hypothetical protein
VETPEPPRERAAARLGKAAEAQGVRVAERAGGGDRERGLSLLDLVLAATLFVVLLLPWIGSGGNTESGWFVAQNLSLLSLAVVLVETLRLGRAWVSRGSGLLATCLTFATGLLGVASLANLRWGASFPSFSFFQYGAWIGLVLAILLLAAGALGLAGSWRSVP